MGNIKIERINESQIKIVLTKDDLLERDIGISELAYNSDKAQMLLREMMEKAFEETGFEADSSPLVIEAFPISMETIVVNVSKVGSNNADTPKISDIISRLPRFDSIHSDATADEQSRPYPKHTKSKEPHNMAVYSFKSIDDAIDASSRIVEGFKGASSFYKYNNRYFVCLQLPFKTAVLKISELENILNEYGDHHVSNSVSRGFLMEHAETLINSNAVSKLASIQ